MNAKNAKQLVYRYNGVDATQEFETDADGSIQLPKEGDIIERNGKKWKLYRIEITTGAKGALPIHTLVLTDNF